MSGCSIYARVYKFLFESRWERGRGSDRPCFQLFKSYKVLSNVSISTKTLGSAVYHMGPPVIAFLNGELKIAICFQKIIQKIEVTMKFEWSASNNKDLSLFGWERQIFLFLFRASLKTTGYFPYHPLIRWRREQKVRVWREQPRFDGLVSVARSWCSY